MAPRRGEDSDRAHTVPKSCCGIRPLPGHRETRDKGREGSPRRETQSRSPQSEPVPLGAAMAEFPINRQDVGQLRLPVVGAIPRTLSPIRTRRGEAHSIPASRHQRNVQLVIDPGCVNSAPQVSNSHIPSRTRPPTDESSPARLRQPHLSEDLSPHVMDRLPAQRHYDPHAVRQLESLARAHSGRGNLSAAVNAANAPQARSRLLKMRIEVELMLTSKFEFSGTLQRFVEHMANHYNQFAQDRFPMLDRKLYPQTYDGGDSLSWYVTGTSAFSRTTTAAPSKQIPRANF